METKHTPGPWNAYDFTLPKTETLVKVGIDCGKFPNGHEIGSAYGHSEEEAFANAKLIAAAPDLLSKLKEALEAIEWYMDNTTPLHNDWQTFHDLGVNIRVSGEELTLKTE